MQTVATLYDRIGIPLSLTEAGGVQSEDLPSFVRKHLVAARLWHLVAWRDGPSDMFGLWHKGRAVAFERSCLANLSIQAATPARGPGWIALMVRVVDQPISTELLGMRGFRQETYEWLLSQSPVLEQLSGTTVSIAGAYPDV